jgi:hypothetical protein
MNVLMGLLEARDPAVRKEAAEYLARFGRTCALREHLDLGYRALGALEQAVAAEEDENRSKELGDLIRRMIAPDNTRTPPAIVFPPR